MVDEQKKGASFNTKDFAAGGLLDDVDVLWENVQCEMYDYGGKSDAAPCVGADLIAEDADPVRQYWSVGSADNWEPSEGGSYMVPVGKDSAFRKGSNIFLMLKSLEEAGFPMERLNDGDITILNGLRAHMVRKPAPKREGFGQSMRRGEDGKEREAKVLLVERIISLPWDEEAPAETKKPKGKAAPKASGKAAPKASTKPDTDSTTSDDAGGSVEQEAKDLLTQLVIDGGGNVAKKDIPSAAFKILGSNPHRNSILALLFKDAFITGNGFTLSSEGEISLG